jgi:hypothetical protein
MIFYRPRCLSGEIVTVNDAFAVLAGDEESVTIMTLVNVPAVVGVPETSPDEASVSPGASPVADHM